MTEPFSLALLGDDNFYIATKDTNNAKIYEMKVSGFFW